METKIVIIEDDHAAATTQTELLKQRGYSVRHAESCTEGKKLVDDWRPDILVLDLILPDGSGLDVLKNMLAEPREDDPDVVVLAAANNIELAYEAMEMGAADFMRTPLDNREYRQRIFSLLKSRARRRAAEIARSMLERDMTNLSRYFSRDVIDAIRSGEISDTLSGDVMPATIMMFDLRNSTSLGETMVPALFFQFLTAFFGEASGIIYNFNGSILKFTGDGFLATFGLRSYSDNYTMLALECAMKLREHISAYNQRRPPYLKNPVGYGIGITTGDVYAGNVGSAHKLEYTVFGDPVNLASRLEGMTKKANVDILIDEKTRNIAGARLKAKRLQTGTIRGKAEAVTMYYPEALQ